MQIEILTVGKITDKCYKELVNMYLLRCKNKVKIELISCKSYNYSDICRQYSKNYTIALDERGKQMNSLEFADWLKNKLNSGYNKLVFYLGPAEGFDKEFINSFNEIISCSKFTLNHQLALLVFCEQLYRAISILFGEPYHK